MLLAVAQQHEERPLLLYPLRRVPNWHSRIGDEETGRRGAYSNVAVGKA